jgi:peptidoglycan/xylan/chitin deacetylase (PgdA/CDA1 family)
VQEDAMWKNFFKSCFYILRHDVQRTLGLGPVFCKGIHILMYHRICSQRDELGLAISPEFFEAQIRYLKNNFTIISLDQALEKIPKGTSEPLFVITFDDGYRDNFTHAYPILRRYGAPATIFITFNDIESGVTDWHRMDSAIRRTDISELDLDVFGLGVISISTMEKRADAIRKLHRELKQMENGRRLEIVTFILKRCRASDLDRIMLTWEDVRQMADENLVTIGSHTLSHPILTRITSAHAQQEIEESRRRIEEMIERPVRHFAYPNGDYNAKVMELVKRSGYSSACTTVAGCNENQTDLFALRRIDVTYDMCENITGHFSPRMFAMSMATEAQSKEEWPSQKIKPAAGV